MSDYTVNRRVAEWLSPEMAPPRSPRAIHVRRVPIPPTDAVISTLVEPSGRLDGSPDPGEDGYGLLDLRDHRAGERLPVRGRLRDQVYEKRFANPGALVRVPFGAFAAELWSQLERPQRLSPQDRLDVLIQVYRVFLPIPVDVLKRLERSCFGPPFELRPLDPRKARALGLDLPGEPGAPAAADLPLRVAEPGQRLWALRLLSDPTVADQPGRPAGRTSAPDAS